MMRNAFVLVCLALLPACAVADGAINLNARYEDPVQVANAIDSTGLPMCLRQDEEDWSDISD